jgi:putative addiction module component (TIGR02574 family)
MTPILEKIERAALSLPDTERAFLADRLLSSLVGEALSNVDAAWVDEAERRYAEYKEGKRQLFPASEVFAEADRMFR